MISAKHYIQCVKRELSVKYYYRILKRTKSGSSGIYIIIFNFYCFYTRILAFYRKRTQ